MTAYPELIRSAPKSAELLEAWADAILFAKVEVYTGKRKRA